MRIAALTRPRRWGQHVAGAFMLVGALAATAWARMVPVEIISTISPTPGSTPHLRHGEYLVVERNVKWHREDCAEVFVTSSMIDSRGFNHALETKFLGRPTLEPYTYRDWPTPDTGPDGPWRYRAKLTFWCPPFYQFWPIVVELQDIQFMMTKP